MARAAQARLAPALLPPACGLATSGGGDPTWTPPPDASRGATADLCDVHHPESVDVTSHRKIQIMEPVFRWVV